MIVSLADEFRSRNFSIYAQWLGVISILRIFFKLPSLLMVVCIALGIANIFHASLLMKQKGYALGQGSFPLGKQDFKQRE